MKKRLMEDIHSNDTDEQVKPETRTSLCWVDANQLKKLNKFSKHKCALRYHGAIGGALTYSFTPTSLGVVIKAKCACGKEVDVSDYEGW
jgi:hypothetical protein